MDDPKKEMPAMKLPPLQKWGRRIAPKMLADTSPLSTKEKEIIKDIMNWICHPEPSHIYMKTWQPDDLKILCCLPYILGSYFDLEKLPDGLIDLSQPILILASSSRNVFNLLKHLEKDSVIGITPFLVRNGFVSHEDVKNGAHYRNYEVKDKQNAKAADLTTDLYDIVLCTIELSSYLPDNCFSIVFVLGNPDISEDQLHQLQFKFAECNEVIIFGNISNSDSKLPLLQIFSKALQLNGDKHTNNKGKVIDQDELGSSTSPSSSGTDDMGSDLTMQEDTSSHEVPSKEQIHLEENDDLASDKICHHEVPSTDDVTRTASKFPNLATMNCKSFTTFSGTCSNVEKPGFPRCNVEKTDTTEVEEGANGTEEKAAQTCIKKPLKKKIRFLFSFKKSREKEWKKMKGAQDMQVSGITSVTDTLETEATFVPKKSSKKSKLSRFSLFRRIKSMKAKNKGYNSDI